KRAAYFDFGVPACQCGLARYLLGGGSPRGGSAAGGADPRPGSAGPAGRTGAWSAPPCRRGPPGAADGPVIPVIKEKLARHGLPRSSLLPSTPTVPAPRGSVPR